MRIRQLDLIAFGHFTGESLSLNPGETGIDIIYGPNEAGKSTTLRAVQCLLFGFPARTSDSFLHANTKLRVGATLVLPDSSTLSVVRRKGNVKTLRDQRDDEVVDDGQLAALLGPLESDSFRSRFALDGEELARGGQAIVNGHGELAAALFAAASSGRQLDELRSRLEKRAAELFKERASKPTINTDLKRLSELKEQIRDASLPPVEWQQTREELDRLDQRRDEISARLSELEAAIRQRERFRDALPSIARRREATTELERLGDVPSLSDDFSDRRSSTVAALASLRQQIASAEADLESRRGGLDKLDVSDELLSHDATIRELRDDVRRIRELRNSVGDRAREIEQLKKMAAGCLRELRWSESDELPDSMRPSSSLNRRLDQLRGEFQKLQQKQHGLTDREADQQAAISDAQQLLAATPPITDYAELKLAVELARQAGPLERQRDEARAEQQRLTAKLDSELAGLTLWTGSVDDLERLAVPLTETLDRFEQDIAALEQSLAEQQRELAQTNKEISKAEIKLSRLTADRDVPTEQSLTEARELRDRGWQLLAQRLPGIKRHSGRDTSTLSDEEAAFVAAVIPDANAATPEHLIAAYEQTLRHADQIGDQLRRKAQLVADAAALRNALRELLQHREEIEATVAATQNQLSEQTSEWCDHWTPLEIEPLSPREMKEWCRRRLSILERAADVRLSAEKVAQLELQIEQQTRQLSDQVPIEKPASLASLLKHAEGELAARIAAENSRRLLSDSLQKEQVALQKLQRERESVERELADWQSRWQPLAQELGAANESDPNVALHRLQQIESWFATRDQKANLDTANQQAHEQSDAFDQRAMTVLTRLAGDLLPAADLTVAIEELDSRRELNRTLATKRDQAQHELQLRETGLEDAKRKLAETESTLQLLCREAKAGSIDDLPNIEHRAELKRRAEERLHTATESLATFSGGLPLDQFADEAAVFALEQLDAEIAEQSSRRDELRAELDDVLDQRGKLSEKLSGWTGESRAAQANEDREGVLAGIRSDAEEFARLVIVSEVLGRTGERYREKHQGPVLGQASELFRELTCGAFSGIQTDYDDKGMPIIVGLRGGSSTNSESETAERVAVSGMSEGTNDQLYLALRLASLDEYLSQHEPVPLLIDDLLIRFDDARTSATLRVLGELSRRTQVILFTHHEHILDLASSTLDDDLLHIHRLDGR
ncbi:AAA family ATPase [bacterium]|nr:AAA family ATPase [bacterium]